MTPERMEKISEVLEQALLVERSQRGDYLDEACAGDSELRREVESLLDSHEKAGSAFLNVAGAGMRGTEKHLRCEPVHGGRRIGAYLVEQEIGHGGMGEVFSAVRVDGQYQKKVAIKLVRAGLDSSFVLERFRNERQILAGLDHPNIARLLDGGTTEDGVPYLVMELIEGVPISDYCDARKLNISARLQLFRQVCGAVQYAHQRLVIHRDIKPSNILVTPEGVAKLLDFGIAKLVDASGATEATILRPMTPEYASPEQVRGELITTATDVYSLGVVLYQLLTGRFPYRLAEPTPTKLAEVITHEEPEWPSTSVLRTESVTRDGCVSKLTPESVSSTREDSPHRLQRRLRGDLDAILLKSLRKESTLRYVSVDEFAQDIRNHLERLPVGARKGTRSYRAGKFMRRHRASVAAAALVMVTLATGAIVTLREARIAEANRLRAEARFNDVRKLANSLMFEVHDSIENIPGATQARKLILQRSLEYLAKLERDSGNDPALLRELATAYRRIGSAQGNPKDPNLGDVKGALTSFQKSLELRESLVRLNPKNNQDQEQLAIAFLDYSDFLSGSGGNLAVGFEYSKKGLAILEPLAAAKPNDVLILTQCFRGHSNLAMMEVGEGTTGRIGTTADAIADLQKALAFAHQVIPLSPQDLSLIGQEAIMNGLLGEVYLSSGNRQQAITYYRHAMETLNDIEKKQNNVRAMNNEAILEGKVGDALLMDGKTAEAMPYFIKAHQIQARLAALDPDNIRLREGEIDSTAQLGHALFESGHTLEGMRYLREAIGKSENEPTQTLVVRIAQAGFRIWLGQALERDGKTREALAEYSSAKKLLSAMRTEGANDVQTQVSFCTAADRLGSALLVLGEAENARKEFDQAVLLLEAQHTANREDQEVSYALAETYTGEGSVFMRMAESSRNPRTQLANWQAARDWYQKSLDTWSKVSNPTRLSANGIEMTLPTEISRRLAACNARIAALSALTEPAPTASIEPGSNLPKGACEFRRAKHSQGLGPTRISRPSTGKLPPSL